MSFFLRWAYCLRVIVAVKIPLRQQRLPGACDLLQPGCSTAATCDVDADDAMVESQDVVVVYDDDIDMSPYSRSRMRRYMVVELDDDGQRLPSRARRKSCRFQPFSFMKNTFSLQFYALLAFITILMIANIPTGTASGIGCFVCSSFNGSNPECEDTFNSSVAEGATGNIANYQFPCWAFKKNRQGLFPADHCIKISGHRKDDPDHTIVIRTCAMDSGTLTADTEIVRISHCGFFKYEGHQFSGCVQACDTDGCNSANAIIAAHLLPLWVIAVGSAVLTASL